MVWRFRALSNGHACAAVPEEKIAPYLGARRYRSDAGFRSLR